MAKAELVQGSWHNAGYHGHFRSKSRTDFLCEYRHLAKPSPPKKFIHRATDKPTKHLFSMHDNRNSFMNDALYFEQGLGRRRIRNNTNRYQNDLLMWTPDRITFERGDPSMSVYKVDYPIVPGSDNVKQKFTRRPKTSFDDDRLRTTSYRYAHCGDNPNRNTISAMSNDGLGTVTNRRQKGSFISGRESVATCMNWYIPQLRRTSVAMSTQTHEPHPPTTSVADDATRGHVTIADGTSASAQAPADTSSAAPTASACTHTAEVQQVSE